jgi:hypothetical protein
MKTLDYYVKTMDRNAPGNGSYLSLIQQNISGGRITKQQIDTIRQFPDATEIAISGLTQSTFEYFIKNHGSQFKAIIFWKCPLVEDLKAMELLDQVEYIVYFWNQRAENLWDFSKTKSLKGFCYDDFTRMHDLSETANSPALEELSFGNRVWTKYILNTLNPIREIKSLKNLSFSAKRILDTKIEPIADLKKLEQLSFPSNQFTTGQIAWLKAHLPDRVASKILQACWTIEKPINMNGKNKDTFIVGKGKPFLDSTLEKEKIKKYTRKFNETYQWYLENPDASYNDYK